MLLDLIKAAFFGGKKGMNIHWDHFVNQYDTTRYSSPDGRDMRHIQFVREFASAVSMLLFLICFFVI